MSALGSLATTHFLQLEGGDAYHCAYGGQRRAGQAPRLRKGGGAAVVGRVGHHAVRACK